MAKQYYIKKDPSASGTDIEWIAINGKDFYQLITSPAGKGRYFIDMDEFMIEATEAEYKDWRKEKDHSDYLHEQESQVQVLSLCGGEDDSHEDMIPDTTVSTEEAALQSLELQELAKALKMLNDDEYSLIPAPPVPSSGPLRRSRRNTPKTARSAPRWNRAWPAPPGTATPAPAGS